jgi:hypothetical protein
MARTKASTKSSSASKTSKTTAKAKTTTKRSQPAPKKKAAPAGPDQIACLAYEIWQQQGRPQGRDLDNWIQAEHQLNGR